MAVTDRLQSASGLGTPVYIGAALARVFEANQDLAKCYFGRVETPVHSSDRRHGEAMEGASLSRLSGARFGFGSSSSSDGSSEEEDDSSADESDDEGARIASDPQAAFDAALGISDTTLAVDGTIDERQFSSSRWVLNLTGRLVVPDGVRRIEAWAFKGCTRLRSVSLPPSLTFVGDFAFDGCTALEMVESPRDAIQYGQAPFCGCVRLQTACRPARRDSSGDGGDDGSGVTWEALTSGSDDDDDDDSDLDFNTQDTVIVDDCADERVEGGVEVTERLDLQSRATLAGSTAGGGAAHTRSSPCPKCAEKVIPIGSKYMRRAQSNCTTCQRVVLAEIQAAWCKCPPCSTPVPVCEGCIAGGGGDGGGGRGGGRQVSDKARLLLQSFVKRIHCAAVTMAAAAQPANRGKSAPTSQHWTQMTQLARSEFTSATAIVESSSRWSNGSDAWLRI
jgi:hypothetical protein